VRPLRIAYVINSTEGGGAALPVPSVARVLRSGGAQVRVFALTRRNGRALPVMEAAGLEPAVRDGGERDHIAALRWLGLALRTWRATHMVTSLSRATVLGLLLGPAMRLPVVAWQHNAYLKPVNLWLLRALQSRARFWVADSTSVAELTRARLGVDDKRLLTWPLFAADPKQPQAVRWQPGQTLQLGSLGRLHAAKGYDLLIAALGRLHRDGFVFTTPYRLTIAGEGDDREHLLKLAAQAQVPLQLPGFTNDPQRFLSGLHLYLQPSRREGFCIAAHEAMSAGLPILASAVGELAHSIVQDKTGLLTTAGDVDALASQLAALLADPGRLSEMGQAACVRVNHLFAPARFDAAGRELLARLAEGDVV